MRSAHFHAPTRAVSVVAACGLAAAAMAHPGGEEARLAGSGDPGLVGEGLYPSSGIQFVSQVPVSAFPGGSTFGNDCWGYTSPTGTEIAIIGLEEHIGFVDISNPFNPQIIGTFAAPNSLWQDMKVVGDRCYAVSEGGSGIRVYDLSAVDNGVVTFAGQVTTGGSTSTHNIVAHEESGALIRVGGGSNIGMRIYTTGVDGTPGTPDSPSLRRTQTDLYVHDAQVVTWNRPGPYQGRIIAFCCSGFGNGSDDTALRIYDITNAIQNGGAIQFIRQINYPSRSYSHQGWLSEDQTRFYLNDETDEGVLVGVTTTRIFNVSDLDSASFLTTSTNGNTARDHNNYVNGQYLYSANYRSGLRIEDISNPNNPVEVGFFDTYPADDSNEGTGGYDGAWSNYPYFESGHVIISDIQQGLIVVKPQIERIDFTPAAGFGDIPETFDPAGGTEIFYELSSVNTSLTGTPRLAVRDAGGTVNLIPGTEVVAGIWRFATETLDCETTAEWWVEADSTSGATFTEPFGAPFFFNSAPVATGVITSFDDNGNTNLGYSVSGAASDGQWDRGTPANGDRGDPPADFDGSGQCWLTDNVSGNSDVDGGSTILTGPVIDASQGGSYSYAYWLADIPGGELGPGDGMTVEVATNSGGTNWQQVRSYNTAIAAWRTDTLLSGTDFAPTSTLRVRYTVTDAGDGDVVEGAIDAVKFQTFECITPVDCPADVNGDGLASPADFTAWLSCFNDPGSAPFCDRADVNGSGAIDPADFTAWLGAFNAGCD